MDRDATRGASGAIKEGTGVGVEERIAAAIAAGGVLLDDAATPAYWVFADAQGNRAFLTIWQGRE